jgi:hypothetical protein
LREKAAQLRRCFELGHGIEHLERAGECVGQLHIVRGENSSYCGSKYSRWTSYNRLLGASSLPSTNAAYEDQLGPLIGDLCLPPVFDLELHRFEVPLDPVHSDGKSINQIEALAVLGQNGREHARDNVS